jgi:AcrR family transcriptional regulator
MASWAEPAAQPASADVSHRSVVSDSTQPRKAPSRAAEPARGRRLGRPPRIDRAAIAQAAGEIPLDELTLRSVAERLGVSVSGLYHYVSGREDLIRLAAEQSALRLTMPVDHGQHWAVWFYEWADYTRRAFVRDPELLKHFIDGAIGADVMAPNVDAAIGLCMRQGFTARHALEAYDLVSECALGSAISVIRAERNRREGSPFDLEVRALIARGAQLPHLRRLLEEEPLPDSAPFRRQISTVLAGIAAQRAESWPEIEALLPPPAHD